MLSLRAYPISYFQQVKAFYIPTHPLFLSSTLASVDDFFSFPIYKNDSKKLNKNQEKTWVKNRVFPYLQSGFKWIGNKNFKDKKHCFTKNKLKTKESPINEAIVRLSENRKNSAFLVVGYTTSLLQVSNSAPLQFRNNKENFLPPDLTLFKLLLCHKSSFDHLYVYSIKSLESPLWRRFKMEFEKEGKQVHFEAYEKLCLAVAGLSLFPKTLPLLPSLFLFLKQVKQLVIHSFRVLRLGLLLLLVFVNALLFEYKKQLLSHAEVQKESRLSFLRQKLKEGRQSARAAAFLNHNFQNLYPWIDQTLITASPSLSIKNLSYGVKGSKSMEVYLELEGPVASARSFILQLQKSHPINFKIKQKINWKNEQHYHTIHFTII